MRIAVVFSVDFILRIQVWFWYRTFRVCVCVCVWERERESYHAVSVGTYSYNIRTQVATQIQKSAIWRTEVEFTILTSRRQELTREW
jgi:hypothetical protein